jgi:hypothetical protein
MKFTTYYSNVIKAQGVPHLSVKAHARLMNIIFLEGALYHLHGLKAEGQSKVNLNKKEYQLYDQLYKLTNKQSPQDILQDLLAQSV